MEETKYNGRFIRVTEESIDSHTWERVYLPSGVIILPIDENGKILMIEEKRPHEASKSRLKFVSGHLEMGEDVLETANRELQEEVGLKASKLEIFYENHSSGTVNNSLYFVTAQDLSASKLPNPDGEDTIISTQKYDIDEIITMFLEDKIRLGLTAAALFKLKHNRNIN